MISPPLRSAPFDPARPELRLVPFSFWLPHSGRVVAGAGEPCPPAAGPGGHPDPNESAGPLPDSGGRPAPSLPGLHQAMAEQLAAVGHPCAEPLRWAITGVDPQRGLRLEGIGLSPAADWAGEAGAPAPTADQA